MMTRAPPKVRRNYHCDCEISINIHINLVLYASNVYQSMALYFDQDDVALRSLYLYFLKLLSQKKVQANRLMEFQYMRGARVHLPDIQKPEHHDWQSSLTILECALHLEKSLNQNLLELHQLAAELKDAQICDFLECYYLHQENKTIKELENHHTRLNVMRAPEDGTQRRRRRVPL